MDRLRVRVAARGRVELHELVGSELVLGSGAGADLVLFHPSVAPRHARLLVRRGRPIVVALGEARAGVVRGEERLAAPVVVEAGEPFFLGEVELAILPPGAGPAPEGASAELESPAPRVRRFLLGDGSGELVVPEPGVPELDRWLEAAADPASAPGFARVQAQAHPPALLEAVAPGVRLEALLAAVERGWLSLPAEAAVVILAELLGGLDALHARGRAHGQLEPRVVQLGAGGEVQVLRPGPVAALDDPALIPALSPSRRLGLAASPADDRFAFAVLAARFQVAGLLPPFAASLLQRLRHAPEDPPGALASALRAAAHEAGLDPAAHHLARVVRVLAPELERPLAASGGAASGEAGWARAGE